MCDVICGDNCDVFLAYDGGKAVGFKRGCRQMASDCELNNELSRQFHYGAGFTEANRIICFVKNIE